MLAGNNALPIARKVNSSNKQIVLDLIRFKPGGISRADIARKLSLSRSAVSSIVNELLTLNIIREAENGPATGGRRPILLELNEKYGYLVGVDIGATHLTIVITDFSSQVLYDIDVPIDINQGPQQCLDDIDHHFRSLLERSGLSLGDIIGIGVGVPGPVVYDVGMVISPPIMPGWSNFPIRSYLEKLWKTPIFLNNDAELGALGEWAYGAGRGERFLVYLKVGTGIGAGFLIDGQIYKGISGTAGEIGHVTIAEDGPVCTCGSRGCLEAMAGGYAIARKAQQAVKAGRRTRLSKIHPIENITAQQVTEAARKGDLLAQEIVAEAGELLGIAIASVINLLNPSIVVVGGGVSQMGDLLLEPIRLAVESRSLKVASESVRITTAVLGRRSSSMGAIVQALSMAIDSIISDGKV